MSAEMSWHGRVFPLPELQPLTQGRRLVIVGDRPDPMGWSAGYPVVRAGLDHRHDAASGRARRAGEWSEHARGGDQHGVWTASDGGTKFFNHREDVVGCTRGTDDDGERAVGTAVRRSQRSIPSYRPDVLTPSMFQRPVGPGYGSSAISRAFLIATATCRCCWTVRPVT